VPYPNGLLALARGDRSDAVGRFGATDDLPCHIPAEDSLFQNDRSFLTRLGQYMALRRAAAPPPGLWALPPKGPPADPLAPGRLRPQQRAAVTLRTRQGSYLTVSPSRGVWFAPKGGSGFHLHHSPDGLLALEAATTPPVWLASTLSGVLTWSPDLTAEAQFVPDWDGADLRLRVPGGPWVTGIPGGPSSSPDPLVLSVGEVNVSEGAGGPWAAWALRTGRTVWSYALHFGGALWQVYGAPFAAWRSAAVGGPEAWRLRGVLDDAVRRGDAATMAATSVQLGEMQGGCRWR